MRRQSIAGEELPIDRLVKDALEILDEEKLQNILSETLEQVEYLLPSGLKDREKDFILLRHYLLSADFTERCREIFGEESETVIDGSGFQSIPEIGSCYYLDQSALTNNRRQTFTGIRDYLGNRATRLRLYRNVADEVLDIDGVILEVWGKFEELIRAVLSFYRNVFTCINDLELDAAFSNAVRSEDLKSLIKSIQYVEMLCAQSNTCRRACQQLCYRETPFSDFDPYSILSNIETHQELAKEKRKEIAGLNKQYQTLEEDQRAKGRSLLNIKAKEKEKAVKKEIETLSEELEKVNRDAVLAAKELVDRVFDDVQALFNEMAYFKKIVPNTMLITILGADRNGKSLYGFLDEYSEGTDSKIPIRWFHSTISDNYPLDQPFCFIDPPSVDFLNPHLVPQQKVTSSFTQVLTEDSEREELLNKINKHFNLSDLKDLCFILEVKFENIGGDGEGTKGKARELIAYMERRGRLPELKRKLTQERPKIIW